MVGGGQGGGGYHGGGYHGGGGGGVGTRGTDPYIYILLIDVDCKSGDVISTALC